MNDLNYYKEKIKERRKQTNFMDFVTEIPAWIPFSFYKNSGLASRYPASDRSPKIVTNKKFIEERDNILNYGLDYDFTLDFFANFKKLFKNVPLSANISQMAGENTDYADTVVGSQNVYLSNIVVENCENVAYSFQVLTHSNNVFNSSVVYNHSENIYFSKGVISSFKVFYSKYVDNCSNVRFSSNLIGCRECILCNDLDNQSYCINNTEYSKEEYFLKKQKILSKKGNFFDMYTEVDNNGKNTNSLNVVGKFIKNSENIENGFSVIDRTKNSRNIMFTGFGEDFYDCFDVGLDSKDFYGVEGGGTYSNNIYCSSQIETCYNIFYCYYCNNSNNCLGCIGLSNKSYCIFNKQFTKKEWLELSSKIFNQMDNDNTLGDFFSAELCPFYFNDTFAGIFSQISKQKAESLGYLWRDEEIKVDVPEGVDSITTQELDKYEGVDAKGNWKISPEILNKVIVDEKGNTYKIVQMEYDFLVKHGLPLPRLHWLDRMKCNFGV